MGSIVFHLTQFTKLVKSGVDEEHVDPACLRLHGFVNAVDIGKVSGVALDGSDVAFDCGDRLIKLGLAADFDTAGVDTNRESQSSTDYRVIFVKSPFLLQPGVPLSPAFSDSEFLHDPLGDNPPRSKRVSFGSRKVLLACRT